MMIKTMMGWRRSIHYGSCQKHQKEKMGIWMSMKQMIGLFVDDSRRKRNLWQGSNSCDILKQRTWWIVDTIDGPSK